MRIKKRKNGGFSLVELLVTITILVVLTAFLVPTFTSVVQDSRQNQDIAKFDSVCVAFKAAMAEPDVQKDVAAFVDDGVLTIVCQIDEDGTVVFEEAQVFGKIEQKSLEETLLWQHTLQYVGDRYKAVSSRFTNKYLVFTITPKTESSTAKCEYVVVKSLGEVGL